MTSKQPKEPRVKKPVVKSTRKSIRQEGDFYETPAWAVKQFFEAIQKVVPNLTHQVAVADPFAGRGAILQAARDAGFENRYAIEINPDWRPSLERVCGEPGNVKIEDSMVFNDTTDGLIVTNPPYKGVIEAVMHWYHRAPVVAMLLQIPFLSSTQRHELMATHPPSDIFRLAHRPSFVWICRETVSSRTVTSSDGEATAENVQCDQSMIPGTPVCPACGSTRVGAGTNMVEYAWVVWRQGWKHPWSKWHYLPTVPAKDRKVEKRAAP